MRIIHKKATSHIEIVLSFVIFVGFVVFFLAVFNPLKFSKKDYSSAEIAEKRIMANISTNLSFVTIILNDSVTASCFSFDSQLERVIVRNQTGFIVNATGGGGSVKIERGNSRFFYIYSYDNFVENSLAESCVNLPNENYTLGLSMNLKVISNRSFANFKQKFETNPVQLRTELGISSLSKFVVNVTNTRGTGLFGVAPLDFRNRPRNIEVFVKESPVQVIYENGALESGILHVEVWQ